ncbi:hypothetical protein ACWJJH_19450 [Endozoicomonadaceae bacterium StTr2]
MYRIEASIGQTTELFDSSLYSAQACAFITAQAVFSAIKHPVAQVTTAVLDQWISLGIKACQEYKTGAGLGRLSQVSYTETFKLFGLDSTNLLLPRPGTEMLLEVNQSDDLTILEQSIQPAGAVALSTADTIPLPSVSSQQFLPLEQNAGHLLTELLTTGKLLEIADGCWPRNHALSIGFLKTHQTLVRKLFTDHPGSPGHLTALVPLGPSPEAGWCFFNSKGEPGNYRGYAWCVDHVAEVPELTDYIVTREMLYQSSLAARVHVWKHHHAGDLEKEYVMVDSQGSATRTNDDEWEELGLKDM